LFNSDVTLKTVLTVTDHNRDSGYRYIYPVLSRRAGGVSIGINLNVNNACNWRCIYCNVPNLTRGFPPPIDVALLEEELRTFLDDILHGDFMQQHVSEPDRQLKDIAFSGNGEPTTAAEFPSIVPLVCKVLSDVNLLGHIKIRVITNGSMMHKPAVLRSLQLLSAANGEVWFKLDAGTKAEIARINDVHIDPNSHMRRLKKCAAACPTFIQTCVFTLDGEPPSVHAIAAYLTQLTQVSKEIQGVHLYGMARQSLQAEAARLSQVSPAWLDALATQISGLGIAVHVSA
jgi:wyosine [tRNA(Phe)-imidazoG37] synthetase (radical SAM superfamily)